MLSNQCLIFGILMVEFCILVSTEDKIVNNNITTNIVINGVDDENLPDYSILFKIDIRKNISVSKNSDFVIVNDSGIPNPEGINMNLPGHGYLIRKIRSLDEEKQIFRFQRKTP